jgi:hypothetical protein
MQEQAIYVTFDIQADSELRNNLLHLENALVELDKNVTSIQQNSKVVASKFTLRTNS